MRQRPTLPHTFAYSTIPPAGLNLRRFAGVSEAGARSRNPERSEGSALANTIEAMTGKCEHCTRSFDLDLLHCGFGDCSYAYCDSCGKTALLSGWSKEWPAGVKCTQAEICADMEPHLEGCSCGGRFLKGSSPRCPQCKERLSADKATEYIEDQAPGTKKGWRWQRSWSGIYGVIINELRVADNFKTA